MHRGCRPIRLLLGRIRLALSQLDCTHAHEILIWASKGRRARHISNYELINGVIRKAASRWPNGTPAQKLSPKNTLV